MIRCSRCIYPDTRPDANFVDGVCSGCRSYEQRRGVDWAEREAALSKLLAEASETAWQRGALYDAVVPVSGGKDSTYQVVRLQQLGARVLAVNAATDMLSEMGRLNLDNLKRFVDVIEVTPKIEVRKKLVRYGLNVVGDLSLPEHMAIWAIPTRVAMQFNVPLVVWGEQPQREYAAPADVPPPTELDANWVAEFGGLLGVRLADLVGQYELTKDDLAIYEFPVLSGLPGPRPSTRGIWLGDYEDWDGWRNGFVAQMHGFRTRTIPVEQSTANYENLDNHVTVLRDYLRYLKYGYTRATDILCNHVRRGRLGRDTAIELEARAGYAEPKTSLGKPLVEVLRYFDIPLEEWRRAKVNFRGSWGSHRSPFGPPFTTDVP